MAQMIFTEDYKANQFVFDRAPIHPVTTIFKKGYRAGITEQENFGRQKRLVAIAKVNGRDFSFDVTNAPLMPFSEQGSGGIGNIYYSPPPQKKFKLFSCQNIIFGIGIIGIIIIINQAVKQQTVKQ